MQKPAKCTRQFAGFVDSASKLNRRLAVLRLETLLDVGLEDAEDGLVSLDTQRQGMQQSLRRVVVDLGLLVRANLSQQSAAGRRFAPSASADVKGD